MISAKGSIAIRWDTVLIGDSNILHLACDLNMLYNKTCRARRGVSGALYPQSAIAELNPCLRLTSVESVYVARYNEDWVLRNSEL
jgi:hypothetical protein